MMKLIITTTIMTFFLEGITMGSGGEASSPYSSFFLSHTTVFCSKAVGIEKVSLYDIKISAPGPQPFLGLLQTSENKDQ